MLSGCEANILLILYKGRIVILSMEIRPSDIKAEGESLFSSSSMQSVVKQMEFLCILAKECPPIRHKTKLIPEVEFMNLSEEEEDSLEQPRVGGYDRIRVISPMLQVESTKGPLVSPKDNKIR